MEEEIWYHPFEVVYITLIASGKSSFLSELVLIKFGIFKPYGSAINYVSYFVYFDVKIQEGFPTDIM
jgi:hypothetical protein